MTTRPWREAVAWMAFLAPFFFLVYGGVNAYTATRDDVGAIVFEWERALPFLPWLATPYMSIDLFFGFSVLLARTRDELRTHCYRIVTAIIVSAVGFLLWPLRYTLERPPVTGWNGVLFDVLGGFDKPYNQAPSLHVSLLMILWVIYARAVGRIERSALRRTLGLALHAWFALIAISIVTVHQHHVIDAFTGFAVGVLCLYVCPWPRSSARASSATDPHRRVLAVRYGAGALACTVAAGLAGGWALLLLWPAVALGAVAAGYARLGPAVFQKRDGRVAWPAGIALAPYRWGAWVSYLAHSFGQPREVEVAPGLWLGRLPRPWERGTARAVLDLAAEFAAPRAERAVAYRDLPVLDLTVPDAATLRAAVAFVRHERALGSVAVRCALGRSRSALVVAAVLLDAHEAATPAAAIDRLARAAPWVVLTPRHHAALETFARRGTAAPAERLPALDGSARALG